jgi:sarcosine oxidase subunit alpha
VHLTGRSFKYHRPRGIFAAGSEEPNALVTVRRDAARVTPNLRATQVELYDGLIAESQNRWPSLQRDFGRINDAAVIVLSRGLLLQDLHVAAQSLEIAVRAGHPPRRRLGPRAHRGGSGPLCHRYAHCDVLVVGAGPAGIAAALAAADAAFE